MVKALLLGIFTVLAVGCIGAGIFFLSSKTTTEEPVPAASSARCDDVGGVLNAAQDGCLFSPGTSIRWTDAEVACGTLGGNLISITSASRQDKATSVAKSQFIGNAHVWIGLNDKSSEGSYVWSDGASFAYTNWDASQPVSSTQSNCVALNLNSADAGKWVVLPCFTALQFICEKSFTVRRPNAPAKPTASQASSGNAMIVSLQAPFNGGQAITSYTVTQSPGGATQTSASLTIGFAGLQVGQSYSYTAVATNSVGASQPSEASDPVSIAIVNPGAPGSISPQLIRSHALVSFTPPSNTGGPNVPLTSFTVTAFLASSSAQLGTASGTESPISCCSSPLPTGVSIFFRVTATNSAGSTVSGDSGQQVGSDAAPGIVTPGAVLTSASTVTVTWANTSAYDHFRVQLHRVTGYTSTAYGAAVDAPLSPLVFSGVSAEHKYFATIQGFVNGQGGDVAKTAHASVSGVLPAPPNDGGAAPVASIAGSAAEVASFSTPVSYTCGCRGDGGWAVLEYIAIGASSDGGVPINSSGSAAPIRVGGGTAGKTYTFTVVARTTLGFSAPSQPSNAVVLVTPSTPAQPVILNARGHGIVMELAWTVPSDSGSALTGYKVHTISSGTSVTVVGLSACSGLVCSYNVTGLTIGTNFTFAVQATNSIGDGSLSTQTASYLASVGRPDPVTNVQAVAGDLGVSVSFSAGASNGGASITTYKVTSSPDDIVVETASSPAYFTVRGDPGVRIQNTYTFTVVASNGVAESLPVTSNGASPSAGRPDPPYNVTATENGLDVDVTFLQGEWNGFDLSGSVSNFSVFASAAGGNPVSVGNVPSTSQPLDGVWKTTVSGLSPKVQYRIYIAANTLYQTSALSAPSNWVVPQAAPEASGLDSGVKSAAGSSLLVVGLAVLALTLWAFKAKALCFKQPRDPTLELEEPSRFQAAMKKRPEPTGVEELKLEPALVSQGNLRGTQYEEEEEKKEVRRPVKRKNRRALQLGMSSSKANLM